MLQKHIFGQKKWKILKVFFQYIFFSNNDRSPNTLCGDLSSSLFLKSIKIYKSDISHFASLSPLFFSRCVSLLCSLLCRAGSGQMAWTTRQSHSESMLMLVDGHVNYTQVRRCPSPCNRYEDSAHSVQTVSVSHRLHGDGHLRTWV